MPAVTYSISGSAGTSGATVTAGSQGATSDASNNYTITGLANGTYTVTPTNGGCTFLPASLSVTISGANQTGKNFTAICGRTTLASNGFESSTGCATAQVSGTTDADVYHLDHAPRRDPHARRGDDHVVKVLVVAVGADAEEA